MRSVRTTLKIAPKTQDDDYDNRKKVLKDLQSAFESYKNSMEKAKSHVKSAVESLSRIKAAFEKMTGCLEAPSQTHNLVTQLCASVNHITGDALTQYMRSMESDVIPAVLDMKRLCDDCHHLESEREKFRKEYDVYRNEVAKKESEYTKKNKDLSTSKSYTSDVVKRDDYHVRFEEADGKFKFSHDALISNMATCIRRCMVTFFQCTLSLTSSITEEFKMLHTTAQRTGQPTPPSSAEEAERNE